MTTRKTEPNNSASRILQNELQRLQERMRTGYEVKIEWLPSTSRYDGGKRLAEQVIGDRILIYAQRLEEAKELVRHGFIEWLLNRHTRPYRELVNKLITLFEDKQYENKEEIVEAINRLL